MDKLALISGEQFLYWNSIVYTLAAATAVSRRVLGEAAVTSTARVPV